MCLEDMVGPVGVVTDTDATRLCWMVTWLWGNLKTLLKAILEHAYFWSLTVESSGCPGFGVSSQALGCPPIAFSPYASDVGVEF